jgi:hypothetical protein
VILHALGELVCTWPEAGICAGLLILRVLAISHRKIIRRGTAASERSPKNRRSNDGEKWLRHD